MLHHCLKESPPTNPAICPHLPHQHQHPKSREFHWEPIKSHRLPLISHRILPLTQPLPTDPFPISTSDQTTTTPSSLSLRWSNSHPRRPPTTKTHNLFTSLSTKTNSNQQPWSSKPSPRQPRSFQPHLKPRLSRLAFWTRKG